METYKLIGLIISSNVISSVLSSLGTIWVARRKVKLDEGKSRIDEFQLLYKERTEENKTLKQEKKLLIEENTLLKDSLEKMQRRIDALEMQLMLIASADQDSPHPTWVKGRDGRMIDLNQPYEKAFDVEGGDYRGKTDVEYWGNELGTEYWSHDLRVMRTEQPWDGYETVRVDGKEEKWRVTKWPIHVSGVIVGIKGQAYAPLAKDS